MAIGLDNSAVATFSGAGPFTLSFQCSGSQRLLVAVLAGMRTAESNWSWDSAAFNGAALTQQSVNAQFGNNRNVRVAVWTLVNPAAGAAYQLAASANVNLSAARLMLMCLTGVDQVTPVGATGTHAAQTNAFSANLTTGIADAWLVGGAGIRNGTLAWSPGTGVTELNDQSTGSDASNDITAFFGYRVGGAAGSYGFAATASGTNHGVLAAVEIRPAATGGSNIPVLFSYFRQLSR